MDRAGLERQMQQFRSALIIIGAYYPSALQAVRFKRAVQAGTGLD